MRNFIRKIDVVNRRLSPVEAELVITVTLERAASATEIRGRLVGPRCLFASTVEVAYPLRERQRIDEAQQVILGASIPEPSLWDLESPFLYEVHVEGWENGERIEVSHVHHGLRALGVSKTGFRCNGREIALRGRTCSSLSDQEARRFRENGVNVLIMPIEARSPEWWTLGDRYGLLMLGKVESPANMTMLENLAGHPSALGAVLSEQALQDAGIENLVRQSRMLCGAAWSQSRRPPGHVSFLLCEDVTVPPPEIALPTLKLAGEPGA